MKAMNLYFTFNPCAHLLFFKSKYPVVLPFIDNELSVSYFFLVFWICVKGFKVIAFQQNKALCLVWKFCRYRYLVHDSISFD